MKTNNHCIKCEIMEKKRKRKATHRVKEGGQIIPLCNEHYEEWLLEEEFCIHLKEENDGCFVQGT